MKEENRDRVTAGIVGVGLVAFGYFVLPGYWALIPYVLSVFPLFRAITGKCLVEILGLSKKK